MGALAFGLGQKEAENFYAGNTGLTSDMTKQYRSDKTYEQIVEEELNDPEKHISVTGSEGIVSPKSQKTFLAMRDSKEMDRYLNISDTDDILIPFFSLAQTINNFSLHARNSDDENVKKAIAEFLTKTLKFLQKESNYRKIYANANVFFDNKKFVADSKENITDPADTYDEHIGGITEALKGLQQKPVQFIDPKLEPSFYKFRKKTLFGDKDVSFAIDPTKGERQAFSPASEPHTNIGGMMPTQKIGRSATEEEVLQDQIKTLRKQMMTLMFRKAPKSEIDAVKAQIDELNRASLQAVPSVGSAAETPTSKPKRKKSIKKESYEPFVRNILF
jgi:hypothetical protein